MKFEWDKVGGRAYFIAGVVALAAIPALLAYAGLGLVGLLFALPVLAWIAARLLVHGGSSALSWFAASHYREWEGAYYAFNDVQVRIFEDEGRLWFVVDDVLESIGMKSTDALLAAHRGDMREVPGRRLKALDAAGLERLLGASADREAIRFMNWMRREVVRPWMRKREG